MTKSNYSQYLKSKVKKLSQKNTSDDERCLDYIRWHFEVYKMPADRESVNAVMREFQGLDHEGVEKLIGKLVYREMIKIVEDGGSVGWVVGNVY